MFEQREDNAAQEELWLVKRNLRPAPAAGFYRQVNHTLDEMGFAQKVHALCAPAYADKSRGGRPGIDQSLQKNRTKEGKTPFHPVVIHDRGHLIASECGPATANQS